MKKIILLVIGISLIAITTKGQSIPVSNDNYHYYGPNTTWGEYLKVGGDGRGTTKASVVSTNGNLHLDSKNGSATYLNHYSLGNTYINPKGGKVGIGTSSPGYQLDVHGVARFVTTATSTPSRLILTATNPSTAAIASFEMSSNGNNFSVVNYPDADAINSNRTDFKSTASGSYFTFSTAASERVRITSNGNLGVGTTSPDATFHVLKASNDVYSGKIQNAGGNAKGFLVAGGNSGSTSTLLRVADYNNATPFFTVSDGNSFFENGNVGIGTTTPDEKLSVNGNIHTKEIRVDLTGWSDFVFEENYDLPTLTEVENHIEENGHLKDIPSAAEVSENGILLGQMEAKLLQKIEELTLYTIDQEKQIQIEKQKNLSQENLVKKLESKLEKQEIRLKKIENILENKK